MLKIAPELPQRQVKIWTEQFLLTDGLVYGFHGGDKKSYNA